MKILVGISRIFVGILFIISGFIKLNDPLGFSYKLQEYFSEGVLNLEFLQPFALALAVFLVIFEVILGIMLLFGYKVKFTLLMLLGMIVFFTFLTFYSAYFNKVTDCGCFGDALPLTPWQSFTKDVVLLVLIIILWIGKKYITPLVSNFKNVIITFVAFILCMGYAYHVLMHLPGIDFRAYKIGTNITEGMSIPEGAPKARFAYHWKFSNNGKETIITTEGDYPKVTGKFIGVDTEVIDEGYTPPIHDFSIEKGEEDYTQDFLNEEKLIAIILYNTSKSEKGGLEKLTSIYKKAHKEGYKVIALSASVPETTNELKETYKLPFNFYFCDETALKTIVRSNPGILKLHKGTIQQKLHWNDFENLEL